MPPRFAMETSSKDTLPVGKILLVSVAVLAVLISGMMFWMGASAEKEADKLNTEAKDHMRNKEFSEALRKIKLALKTKEKKAYLETEVDILYNQNKYSEVIDALDRLIAQDSKNALYYYLAGNMAFQEEDTEKAIGYMKQAVDISPENKDYQIALGNLYRRNGDIKAADACFEAILKKDPKAINALHQHAIGHHNDGDLQLAVDIVKEKEPYYKNNSDYYFILGEVLDGADKDKEAVKAYYRSLELQPLEGSIAAKRIFEITGKHVPPALEKLSKDQVPFQTEGKLMFVNASVNGIAGRFLVDTGASVSVVFSRHADKFRLGRTGQKTTIEGINGRSVAQYAYGNLQLGHKLSHDVLFAISDAPSSLPADGIVGMDYLDNYRFEIDKASQKIQFMR